ncbi:MAG: DUF4212 domain-containing protein [Telluria sp.]
MPAAVTSAEPTAAQLERRRTLLAERAAHWKRTRKLTLVLLALWFATSFGTVFFARELARVTLFDWPLSFYFAAQGAALIYLAILAAYAVIMRRIDQRFERRIGELE